jgi:23S rRNA pseudouridine1911/1915/1917 synthase
MPSWKAPSLSRLDAFLASEGRTLSRSRAQKAIEAGYVKVNKKVIKKVAFRLEEGDKVELKEIEEKDDGRITPVDLKLEILYEDKACMVISKPRGISVHPGAGMDEGEKTILHGVAHLFKKKKIPFVASSVLVHRLDKETTGCLLIAKTPEAHILLQKQFATRTVQKFYLALVAGIPQHDTAMIDAPIARSSVDRTRRSIQGYSGRRDAQTTYKVLGSTKDVSLLSCELHTGRTHQIRVHLQSIGHAILGDESYSSSAAEKLSKIYEVSDLCLHAWKLMFESPADKKKHTINCPLPPSFAEALKTVGIEAGKM